MNDSLLISNLFLGLTEVSVCKEKRKRFPSFGKNLLFLKFYIFSKYDCDFSTFDLFFYFGQHDLICQQKQNSCSILLKTRHLLFDI